MAPATEALEQGETDALELLGSAQRRIGVVVAGNYRITRHIGSGGSSHVFEAEHVRLGKTFAIKLLRPELDPNRRTAKRFRREARAIARIENEHIISVVDCGDLNDGTPYLVMELLAGEDLRSLLEREGSLPARRAVSLVLEACRGLAAVHQAGLVHRDLKPENLFVARRSTGEDWCKVLDFGVAKMDSSISTAEHAIIGTARYMAPEQLADGAAVAETTDVYALGAILYECLAGQALVSGGSMQEVMYRIMNTEPAPLVELVPTLPRALAQVVERCLRKSPTARPSNAEELATLLLPFVDAPSARTLGVATRSEDDAVLRVPPPPRSPGSLWLAAGIAAALCTGVAGWYARGAAVAPIAASPPREAAGAAPPAPAREAALPDGPLPAATPVATPPISVPAQSTAALPANSAKPAATGRRAAAPPPTRASTVNRFDSTNPYAE